MAWRGGLGLYLKLVKGVLLVISTPCSIPSYKNKSVTTLPGKQQQELPALHPRQSESRAGKRMGQPSWRLAVPAAIVVETAARLHSPTTACPPSSFTRDNYFACSTCLPGAPPPPPRPSGCHLPFVMNKSTFMPYLTLSSIYFPKDL